MLAKKHRYYVFNTQTDEWLAWNRPITWSERDAERLSFHKKADAEKLANELNGPVWRFVIVVSEAIPERSSQVRLRYRH